MADLANSALFSSAAWRSVSASLSRSCAHSAAHRKDATSTTASDTSTGSQASAPNASNTSNTPKGTAARHAVVPKITAGRTRAA